MFHLPPEAQAAGMGRRSVRSALSGVPREVAERIELLVSELVTNSIRHGKLAPDQSIDVRVATEPGCVRVEVADPGPQFDPGERPGPGDGSRWGLFLLDRMVDRWELRPIDHGKAVCFEIDL